MRSKLRIGIVCSLGLVLVAVTLFYPVSNTLYVQKNNMNIGKIKAGNKIHHTFVVRNVCFRTVTIGYVDPSCTCTVAHVSLYNIKPFAVSKISIVIDTTTLPQGRNETGAVLMLSDNKVAAFLKVGFTLRQ